MRGKGENQEITAQAGEQAGRKRRAGRGGQHAAARKRRPLLFFLVFLILLTALVAGVRVAVNALGAKKPFKSETQLKNVRTLQASDEFIERFGESERANFLFLGVSDGMTDTIMVASYDMKNQHVDLISVPRDTYYPRRGYSGASNKINAIYHSKKGGVAMTAEAVSDVLGGMPIHYYMLIDYKGVANIVDAMGGVRFNVPFHMKYDDTTRGKELHVDIPAGEQLLTKKNVVEFLRFRQTNPWYRRQGYKDYGDMDIGRMQTQQEFMKAAFKQAIGPDFMKVVGAVMDNVESDIDMDMVWKLVRKAGGLSADNITSYTLPGDSRMREGASVWILDEDGVDELLSDIYDRTQRGSAEDGAEETLDGMDAGNPGSGRAA